MKSLLRRLLVIFPLLILFLPLIGDTTEANAQQLRETFRRVKQSVVIVRTQEKTIAPLLRQGLVNSGGQASGVLISDDGRVLTAAHVVQAVDKVFVEFSDGQTITARVISSATNADVALLQLDSVPKGVSPARVGDSDQVEVGDHVFVVGAPYGLALTLTVGHVSGRATPKQHLLVELLQEIAGRDSGLAEELARAFTAPVAENHPACACATMSENRENESGPAFRSSPTAAPTQREVERSDLLVGVALQIVERDPTRAMALAQLSLASGVSPRFSQLLLSLRAVDAERADRLFASAVGGLERSRDVDLDSLHTLGAFLVSATDPVAGESVSRGMVVRFLNCGLAQLSRLGQMAAGRQGDWPGIAAEDEAVIDFISRQLGDLFARYMPDRLGQFKRKIAELSATNANDRAIVPPSTYPSNPNEIVREARTPSMAADRDMLYARAAFAWLARGEVSRAQAAASEVAAAATRDRVMIQVARQYSSAGRLDDAVAATRSIRDAVVRANLLMSFVGAVLTPKDGTRTPDLLDEAVGCALTAPPSMTRALTLIATPGALWHLMRGAASKSCRRQLRRSMRPWRKETRPSRRIQIQVLWKNTKQANFTAPVLKPHLPRSGAPISSAPGLWRSNLPQEIFPCLRSWRPVVAGWTDRSSGTSSRGEKMESLLEALCAPMPNA